MSEQTAETVVEIKKLKSRYERLMDATWRVLIIGLLCLFIYNQMNTAFDYRRKPVEVTSDDGLRCIYYRGAISCVKVFSGVAV